MGRHVLIVPSSTTWRVIASRDAARDDAGVPLFADDLSPGQEIPFSRHTVEEAEILEFARHWDPVFIHTDPDAAARTPLGGVIASGLHTMAIYQRLAVEALWSRFAGGVGRSFEARFCRPVRPGTVLTGAATVGGVTPRDGRGDAVVIIDAELHELDGPVVLELRLDAILPVREGGR